MTQHPNEDADRQADAFRPFDNDTQVMTFTDGQDELTLENGPDAVLLAGQLNLSADQAGLRQVRALREALARIESAIEARAGGKPPGTPAPQA